MQYHPGTMHGDEHERPLMTVSAGCIDTREKVGLCPPIVISDIILWPLGREERMVAAPSAALASVAWSI